MLCAVQYKGMFKECLDRAAEEAKAAGAARGVPDTAALAERIEAAFFKHFRAHLKTPLRIITPKTRGLAVLPMCMAGVIFLCNQLASNQLQYSFSLQSSS